MSNVLIYKVCFLCVFAFHFHFHVCVYIIYNLVLNFDANILKKWFHFVAQNNFFWWILWIQCYVLFSTFYDSKQINGEIILYACINFSKRSKSLFFFCLFLVSSNSNLYIYGTQNLFISFYYQQYFAFCDTCDRIRIGGVS